MAQDTAAFDPVFKTVYGPRLINLIPQMAPMLDRFEDLDANDYGGKHIEYPIKISRTQGVGAYSELGSLPQAGRVKTAPVRITVRYFGGRIQLSAQVIEASQGPRHAFENAMEMEMDDLISTMQNDRARIVWGDGRGVLAIVNDTTPNGSATLGVDSPGGFAGSVNGARFMNEDMRIAFINPNTGALRATTADRRVQSFASDGTTITLNSAVGADVQDNDLIVRATVASVSDVTDTSYQKEPMGLSGLTDDGTNVATLHGVNRTTVPLWQSVVIANGGAWTADLGQRLIDLVAQVGGGNVTEWWSHQSVRRTYINSMEADRRYVSADLMAPDSGTKAMKGGTITFGGLPWNVDRFAPFGSLFACDNSGKKRYVLQKGKWEDRDGSVLQRLGTGANAQHGFEAFYYIWDQFADDYPNRSGRIDNISTSTSVAHIY